MAIARNPKRNHTATTEKRIGEFIGGAGPSAEEGADANKKPIMIRIAPEMLDRFDRAAKRLGISRSAFIVSGAAEKLEKMEQTQ
jgi:hypothetical protein